MNQISGRWLLGALFTTIIFITGCATILNPMLMGGSIVNTEYQPKKILVSYHADGDVPKNAKYYLVETEQGEAILEKIDNGTSALIATHWRDELGDHFSSWVATGPGFEFIVPLDRTKPASRYVYPMGQYSADRKRGIGVVVPKKSFQPSTTLTPE